MANAFSKQELTAFEQILDGFEDQLVMSKLVNKYETDQKNMERANNTIWRPVPYIMQSFEGANQTGNFVNATQLSVPASINRRRSSPWEMSDTDLNDALQENRLGEQAKAKLASDINVALTELATMQGTLVIKRTSAPTGYDDIAEAAAVMTEQGVMEMNRKIALSTRSYQAMASNLAARQTMNDKVSNAYETSYVGEIAGMSTHKLNYTGRLVAAAGASATINTTTQYYTPLATTTPTGIVNADNRYQTVTVTTTSGVKAGDCFTIAGVEAVQHITKVSTGRLKTFRVISVTNGTTMVISPPIISGAGGTDAELQYKNVEVSPSATAAIVYLNTATADMNPFWVKDSLEILPGRIAVPSDAGASVLRGQTKQGLELVMIKQVDIQTSLIKYRVDTRFGVVNTNPEMSGIILFNQV